MTSAREDAWLRRVSVPNLGSEECFATGCVRSAAAVTLMALAMVAYEIVMFGV